MIYEYNKCGFLNLKKKTMQPKQSKDLEKNLREPTNKQWKRKEIWEETCQNIGTLIKDTEWRDYFHWKSHKFKITESQAHSNTSMMDNLIKDINEENKDQKLQELKEFIRGQYKQATWENIELSEEQLRTIIEAHKSDWTLWELTQWELRKKVEIISEATTDPKIRRYLLEAGFCGQTKTLKIKSKTDKTNVERLKEEFWIEIEALYSEYINNLKLDFEKLWKFRDLWVEIDQYNIKELNKLGIDFDKLNKLKKIWVKFESYEDIREFNDLDLTNSDLQFIKDFHLINYNEIQFALTIKYNYNTNNMRNYIHRKMEFLKKNRTLPEEKFIKLFWSKWKYSKIEINQKDIWICYALTWFEILKKTNYFNELIQTNLRELSNWNEWEVRIPMGDKRWKRIKIYKDEIDQKLTIIDPKSQNEKEININSESDFLWFKILELAFMKTMVLNPYYSYKKNVNPEILKNAQNEYERTWRITFNEDLLKLFDWWNMHIFLNRVVKTTWYAQFITSHKNEHDLTRWVRDSIKDIVFEYFKTWMINIELGVWSIQDFRKVERNNNCNLIWKGENFKILVNDVRIIDKAWYNFESAFEIKDKRVKTKRYNDNWEYIWNDKMAWDLITNENWKTIVSFSPEHSYSIEKCYIDKNTWEKRVRVINPRHTWIKFDISLEEAKFIFNWGVTWVDINNIFR